MKIAMRKPICILMTMVMIICGSTAIASANTRIIESVDYEGKGLVEVDFHTDVQYKNLKVTVKDNKGKKYKATVVRRDEDDLKFVIKKVRAGRTYTFWIKKVKPYGGRYTTVKGKVKVYAKSKVVVEGVEYDSEDREVSIEFRHRVQWKKARVVISDANGNVYSKYIIERDNDGIEVKTAALRYGKTYKYKISGVKRAGAGNYTTVKGSFKAWDD